MKFNLDSQYDIGVYFTTPDNEFRGLFVYDGNTRDELDSITNLGHTSQNLIMFIPDFGGDKRPDLFIISWDSVLTISFETIFFWQQNVETMLSFVLCIGGMLVGFVIIYQWRRNLRTPVPTERPSMPEASLLNEQVGEKMQENPAKLPVSSLNKLLYGLIIALVVLTVPMVTYLRIESIGLPIQAPDVRLIHLMTFVFLVFYSMIPIVAVLYNISAPIFATSIYMKTQAQFIRAQPGIHDYRVIVLDYGERQKRAPASYFTRSLFPILLAITVGVTLFNSFKTVGTLTGFTGGRQMQEWIFQFELLCALPIILTFMASSLIVPSSWLLDDAGVVYFIENLQYREPGDVSKVSDWFLNYFKAIAGFTALLSYFSLFQNLKFSIEMENLFLTIIMTLAIFAFIILFPFFGGLIYMLVAQITIENNLPFLKQKLYQRMNVMGIDTTPHQLRDVLHPKERDPRAFNKIWQKKLAKS